MTLDGWKAKLNVDIRLLMGNYIDDLAIEFFDDDGVTPMDFSDTEIPFFKMRVYDKTGKGRKLLHSMDGTSELSEEGGQGNSGVVLWDTAFPVELNFGKKSYELDRVVAEGDKRICQGTLEII